MVRGRPAGRVPRATGRLPARPVQPSQPHWERPSAQARGTGCSGQPRVDWCSGAGVAERSRAPSFPGALSAREERRWCPCPSAFTVVSRVLVPNNKETRGEMAGAVWPRSSPTVSRPGDASGTQTPPSRPPFTHPRPPRAHAAPAAQVCQAQPDPPVAPWVSPPVLPSVFPLSPALLCPAGAPAGSPGARTPARRADRSSCPAQAPLLGTRPQSPERLLPLVPKDLLSTLENEVLLDTHQLWPQPREEPCGLSFCLDATSGSLL